MMQMSRCWIETWLMVLLLATLAYAVPGTINYQGVLTDDGGVPLSGTYSMTFRLFDAASAGTEAWSGVQDVTVTGGVYSVQLGSVTSLSGVDFSTNYWLEVAVDGETLTPRQALTSVPYAMKAATAENVNLNSNFTLGDQWISGDGDDEGLVVSDSGQVGIGTTTNFDHQLSVASSGTETIAGYFDANYTGVSESYGVYGKSEDAGSGTHYGVFGYGANSTMVNYGLYGVGHGGSNSYGTFGTASGGTTQNTGVMGYVMYDSSEMNFGVNGYAYNAETNYGVYGHARYGTETNYGVRGDVVGNVDTTSYAIYGSATGSGELWAGYFDGDVGITGQISTNLGIGVSPEPSRRLYVMRSATGSELLSYSGYFENKDTNKYAYGIKVTTDGETDQAENMYHWGIFANASGAKTNYGIRAHADGDGMTSDATDNYGLYGIAANGINNYGVYGAASGGTINYAGYFYGNVHVTGTLTEASDLRLKENILPVENALDKVDAINGVYFNFKDSPDKTMVGVIAQEVQAVLPEAVSVTDSETGYLGVSYTSLVPLLIEAMKELKAQNEALRLLICQDHPTATICQ